MNNSYLQVYNRPRVETDCISDENMTVSHPDTMACRIDETWREPSHRKVV